MWLDSCIDVTSIFKYKHSIPLSHKYLYWTTNCKTKYNFYYLTESLNPESINKILILVFAPFCPVETGIYREKPKGGSREDWGSKRSPN